MKGWVYVRSIKVLDFNYDLMKKEAKNVPTRYRIRYEKTLFGPFVSGDMPSDECVVDYVINRMVV